MTEEIKEEEKESIPMSRRVVHRRGEGRSEDDQKKYEEIYREVKKVY